jgi:hypothetical protein
VVQTDIVPRTIAVYGVIYWNSSARCLVEDGSCQKEILVKGVLSLNDLVNLMFVAGLNEV